MQHSNKLKKFLTVNWRPKLICLILAILLWLWVDYFYVRSETDTAEQWDEDAIQFELPDR